MRYFEFELPVSMSAAHHALHNVEGWETVEIQYPRYVSFQYGGNGAVSVIVQGSGRNKIDVMIVNRHYQNHQLKEVLKAIRAVLSAHASAQS